MREPSDKVAATVEELHQMLHRSNVLAKVAVAAGIAGVAVCLTDLVLGAMSIRIEVLGVLGMVLVLVVAVPLALGSWWAWREYERAAEASYLRAVASGLAGTTGMAGSRLGQRIAEDKYEN
jgi:hypothetical protein